MDFEKSTIEGQHFDRQQADPVDEVVNWYEDDDPEKPLNWSNLRKFKTIVVVCYCTFLTYVLTVLVVLVFSH